MIPIGIWAVEQPREITRGVKLVTDLLRSLYPKGRKAMFKKYDIFAFILLHAALVTSPVLAGDDLEGRWEGKPYSI